MEKKDRKDIEAPMSLKFDKQAELEKELKKYEGKILWL